MTQYQWCPERAQRVHMSVCATKCRRCGVGIITEYEIAVVDEGSTACKPTHIEELAVAFWSVVDAGRTPQI